MRFRGLAYRGHNPRWSFAPVSGAGAAIHGGRFNPRGVESLYLALSPQGAFLEATQGLAYKFNPLTLCTYEVDCEDICDLSTDAARAAAGIALSDLAAPWALDVAEGRRPASWALYDRLQASHAGLLVPSFAVNATGEMINLVLWRWSETLPHKVSVYDPEHRLPKDQTAWR